MIKRLFFVLFFAFICLVNIVYSKVLTGKVLDVANRSYVKLSLTSNQVSVSDKGIVFFYITLAAGQKIEINVAKIVVIKTTNRYSIAKIISFAPGQNRVSRGYLVKIKTRKAIINTNKENSKVEEIKVNTSDIENDKPLLWFKYRHDLQNTGRVNVKISLSPKLVKKIKLDGAIVNEVIFDNQGNIYATAGKTLYKISKKDFKVKWQFYTKDIINSTPVIYANRIYLVSDDNHLYCLNLQGKKLWDFKAESLIRTSPVVFKNKIFFGSWDRYFYALDLSGNLLWKFKTKGKINSSPSILGDNYIVFGSDDHTLYCLSIKDGSFMWKYSTGGKIVSSPAIADKGYIFFGSLDNYIYALDINGKLLWRYKTNGKVYSSPSIAKKGYILIGSNDKNIYAIDFEGNLLWTFKTGYWMVNSFVLNNDDLSLFAGYDKTLYLLKNNVKIWDFKLNKIFKTNPTIDKRGYIYIGNLNRYLYIFK